MRISIACVGRMKTGAERDFFERYLERAQKIGRALGVTSIAVKEFPESPARKPADRKAEEEKLLLGQLAPGAKLVALDEHGKAMSSQKFSDQIDGWKLEGVPEILFCIGGADGHGAELLKRADVKLALGAMTWPHQIARVLLAEQVYRALTIQSGHPYHRE